jgi:flagellar motor switch protein FliN/FliY
MNQMMGSSATSMSTIFNRLVNISPPSIDILDVADGRGVGSLPQEDVFIKVSFRLTIEDLVDSTIMQLLPVSFAKEMVNTLMGGVDASSETAAASAAPVPEIEPPQAQPSPSPQAKPEAASSAPSPQPSPVYGTPHVNRNINVQPVQFSNFSEPFYQESDTKNLDLLLDIPLKVTVELGRTKKQIKEILELSQGSIIELDKLAGEPVDILVNQKLIAKGEVVVIDENFGVRVTDIISQVDRIRNLE